MKDCELCAIWPGKVDFLDHQRCCAGVGQGQVLGRGGTPDLDFAEVEAFTRQSSGGARRAQGHPRK
jgi:hypothetical protein